MARFSDEEVDTLQDVLWLHILSVRESPYLDKTPEYLPFLLNLKEKLQNYQLKHYPEDREDAGTRYEVIQELYMEEMSSGVEP